MLSPQEIEVQKDIYLYFINCRKEFEKVQELLKMSGKFDLDKKKIKIIYNLYWKQTAGMQIENVN